MKRKWYKRLDALLLFIFIVLVPILHGPGQLRIMGLVAGGAFLLYFFLSPSKYLSFLRDAPYDLLFYSLWVIWAAFTGYLIACDMEAFMDGFLPTIQLLLLLWTIFLVVKDVKSIEFISIAIVLGAFVQFIWGLAVYKDPLTILALPNRFRGSMQNPNNLGFLALYASFFVLFYFFDRENIVYKLTMTFLWLIFGFLILSSGSRKSLIAFLIGFLLWLNFAYVARMRFYRKIISIFVILLISILTLPKLYDFLIGKTTLGKRLSVIVSGNIFYNLSTTEDRWDMYKFGAKLFLEHPLAGVGLNNFKTFYWRRTYSHSDYIETLATTGLVGFILYESVYWIVLIRLLRKFKKVDDDRLKYKLRVLIVLMLSVFILRFGSPFYNSIITRTVVLSVGLYPSLIRNK